MGESTDLKNDTLLMPVLTNILINNLLGLSPNLKDREKLYKYIKLAAVNNKIDEIHPDDICINSKLYHLSKYHKIYSQFKIFEKSFYYNKNDLTLLTQQNQADFIEYKFYFVLLKDCLTDRNDSFVGLIYLQNQTADIKCSSNYLKLYESFEYYLYKILLDLFEIKKI